MSKKKLCGTSSGALAKVSVLAEVQDELRRQDGKWGEQNHADGTTTTGGLWSRMPNHRGPEPLTFILKNRVDGAAHNARHALTECEPQLWIDILLEEVAEAAEQVDQAALRTELIQVAAVAAQWVMAIDRRGQK